MPAFIVLLLLLLFSDSASAQEPPDLCRTDEQILFSCVAESGKIISLCASGKLTPDEGYLQYRLKQPDGAEFLFPPDLETSREKFFYGHYFRAQFDQRRVGFDHEGNRYEIFWGYDGESGEPAEAAGITRKAGGQTLEIACRPPFIMNFQYLEGVLPCEEGASDCLQATEDK